MCKPSIQALAVRTAKTSLFPRFRHGAVIENGGRVLSKGVNVPKPRSPNISCSTHAEAVVLKRMLTVLARKKETDSFELYVARVDKTDNIAFSRPCSKCMKMLRDSGIIDVVHFTTNDGWKSIEI
jgi:deoxycytidylate deaminase